MRKFLCILLCALTLLPAGEVQARWNPFRKKTPAVQKTAPAPKKTPYEKFLGKKGTAVDSSFVKIYRQDEHIFLEIPENLMGRRVLLSTVVRSCPDLTIREGADLSTSPVYRIARTDSLVLLQFAASPVQAAEEDSTLHRALAKSRTDAVAMAFPIQCRNADSTGFVVKADKLFDPAQKDVANLKAQRFGSYNVTSATYNAALSALKGIKAYPRSVGVVRDVTYDLKLSFMGFELASFPRFSAETETCLTLLEESSLRPLKADRRIGVRTVTRAELGGATAIKEEKWASRWHVTPSRKIRVYVDTLFAAPWYDAIRKGLTAWNAPFIESGLGIAIQVEPYPAGKDFLSGDPLVSTVSVGNGEQVGATLRTDPGTGEILACKLTVPRDFSYALRKEGIIHISDVDARYRAYNLPEDAVSEALTARIMSIFGRCLGLEQNLAGSYAYSPAQLRDPAFTQKNGITASVTDDVLFNLLARPGDKERGVVTVADRIGPYDRYALRWLYDDSLDREAWIRQHSGKNAYRYLESNRLYADPRAIAGDLGNDPAALFETGAARLKWVAAHAQDWIAGDDVDPDFRALFVEYIWLGLDRYSGALARQVGGLLGADLREGYTGEKWTTVPAQQQRKALQMILSEWMDLSWLDENRELMTLGGPNNTLSTLTRINAFVRTRLSQRLALLALAEDEADGGYTVAEALRDTEELLTRNMRAGKPLRPGEEMLLATYASMLQQQSPVMVAQQNEVTHKQNNLTVSAVPASYSASLETEARVALERLRRTLKNASARYTGKDKGRIAYVLNLVESALDGNKP